MRAAKEFILAVKKIYTETDLMRKDYLTFFKIFHEAQEEQKAEIARMEAAKT